MYIRIYFDDKPLFLCNSIVPEIEPYLHHDDAVYIDEFSPQAVNTMIHEMQQQKVHAGVFMHSDLDALKEAFWKKFTIIKAGGGLIYNQAGEVLVIFRRGKWDLPKGKLDEGETIEQCALREVAEETGLTNVTLGDLLVTTYHTYHQDGHFILKESYWFNMQLTENQALVPQHEEDIEQVKWLKPDALEEIKSDAFPSIRDVFQQAGI